MGRDDGVYDKSICRIGVQDFKHCRDYTQRASVTRMETIEDMDHRNLKNPCSAAVEATGGYGFPLAESAR